ncbi:ABC transporter ATP-binding protein [Gammaproteobacteria bacterium LSUCC0112]|nr:ABC transporter ATP-binding protein [Gammaproteobacteria bacterium LSUCC0112]
MLAIKGLSKTYKNGVRALNNITLDIPTGMFGLLGPNGAGKSSLMRTLATLQEADSGTAFLDDINILEDKDSLRRVLGYLPQDFGSYPKMTPLDMLDHFAVLKGVSNRTERRDMVDSLLHKTNLYDVRKKAIDTFSGGMKQRFGIAQALIGNPRLIIVDEPTAGLDPSERNRFHNLLAEIGENIVVILSTHIVEDVSDLCPNMAIMGKGEILLSGRPREVIDRLRGSIWRKRVTRDALAAYQQQYQVILSHLTEGETVIHVISDTQPAGFEPQEVDLEDVYFSTLIKHDIKVAV